MHTTHAHRLQMATILLTVAILLGPVTGASATAWQPLAGGAVGAAPGLTILEVAEGLLEIDILVPGIFVRQVWIDGSAYSQVSIPGCGPRIERGHPELPILARALRIPGEGTPRLEVLESAWIPLDAPPPIPSRGPLTRQEDLHAVPTTFADVYVRAQVWPGQKAELGRPFLVRDRRGVPLRVSPVRWDGAAGRMEALRHLRLRVVTEGDGGPNAISSRPRPEGRSFSCLMNAIFEGQPLRDGPVVQAEKTGPQHVLDRMLIVTHPSLEPSLPALVSWKQERGYEVEVLTVHQLGGLAAGIHDAVRQRYHSEDGLAHLLLIGDASLVPTNTGTYHGAPSDGMYGLVSGDDLYADVLVSRLPARDAAELDLMVARTVVYERDPQPEAHWYGMAAGIASDEGVPTDYTRTDWLRSTLLSGGYTSVSRIYQGQGGSRQQIAEAANGGLSLINYMGHGSGTGWLSVPFSNHNVHQLTNTTAWPWIIDVACSNGDFVRLPVECFAEAWLRARHDGRPAGAVAVIAASSPASWVPPTVMQSTIVDRLVHEGQAELGALLAAGVAAVLVQYEGTGEGRKLMEQYNLFGDGSLQVRSRKPGHLVVAHPAVLGAGRLPVVLDLPRGARAVVTDGTRILARADQLGAGPVSLIPSRDLVEGETVHLTVTATNAVPYRVALPVGEMLDEPVVPVPALALDLGNWPNPFNPQTTVGFSLAVAGPVRLAVHDARGRLVRLLCEGPLDEGVHHVAWDGRDATGRVVASGVYLARLRTAQGEFVHKMTLAR